MTTIKAKLLNEALKLKKQSDIDKILSKEQSVEIEFSANGKKVKFSKLDFDNKVAY